MSISQKRVSTPKGGEGESSEQEATKSTKLLTISSSKGGSCKSTTARNLAVAAAHLGLSVATVDLDAQQTLAIWHGRRPAAAPMIQNYVFPLKTANDEIKSIIKSGKCDVIIVDTPPGIESHAAEVRMLVRASDFIIIPTQQQSADLDSVTEWSKTVKREGAKFAFLLSRTSRNRRSFQEAKQRLIQFGSLAPIDIRDLASVDISNKMGVGNIEIRRDSVDEDFNAAWIFISRELGLKTPDEV